VVEELRITDDRMTHFAKAEGMKDSPPSKRELTQYDLSQAPSPTSLAASRFCLKEPRKHGNDSDVLASLEHSPVTMSGKVSTTAITVI